MQRRQFIMSSAGMLAAAGMSSTAALAADAAARRALAGQLSAAGFSALLRQSFAVYGGERGATLQLVKVTEVPAQAGMQQFSLHFSGDGGPALESATYELEHPQTGKMMMYLDAHKHGREAVTYRADFSLLQ